MFSHLLRSCVLCTPVAELCLALYFVLLRRSCVPLCTVSCRGVVLICMLLCPVAELCLALYSVLLQSVRNVRENWFGRCLCDLNNVFRAPKIVSVRTLIVIVFKCIYLFISF